MHAHWATYCIAATRLRAVATSPQGLHFQYMRSIVVFH